jgi:polysaccharide chain length determinant protein (PEP-CTERM system associated)
MDDLVKQLISYARGIWKYRWYAVAVAWVVSIVGWVVVYQLPDQYEASARMYVDTDTMLRPLLSGLTVEPNLDVKIMIMSRTLISRENIEKLLRMSDLDLHATSPQAREGLIDSLTKSIKVETAGDNFYRVAYMHKNPQIAKKVVQSLFTIFMEGSLGDKRSDMDTATRFIDDQIKHYEQRLIAAETAVKEFKRRHMGLMPEQGRDYYARLQEAVARVRQARLELHEAENARDAIKSQISGEEPVLLADQAKSASLTPEWDARIWELEKSLDQMRLNYTEHHPDVIATRRILEELKEQRKQAAALKPREELAPIMQSGVFQQLKMALTEAEARVASLKARVADYEQHHDQLKAGVDAVLNVESELAQLNRDYEVHKTNYEALLARRESAQISGEVDAKTPVVEFKIIDPPRVPNAPSAPNRPFLMSLVLVAGIGAGIGVAFLISLVRPTFTDRRTLRDVTGLPLLGTVSLVLTEARKNRRKKGAAAFLLSFLSLLGAYATVMTMVSLTARVN